MKKTIYIFIIFLIIFLTTGCNEHEKFNIQYNKDKMHNATTKIEKNINSIKDDNKTIIEESKNISNNIDPIENILSQKELKYVYNIEESNKNILSKSNNINDYIINMNNYISTIKETDSIILMMSEELQTYKKEKIAAEKKLKSEKLKMFQTIIWFSVIGFGISVVLFFLSSPRIGTAGIIATVSTIVLSIGLSQYYFYVAIAGLIITIGIVGYLIFKVFIQNKAFQEVIETTELTKKYMDKDKKEKVFGNKEKIGITEKIQSKNTKKLVSNKKKKLGKLWNLQKEEEKKEIN